MAPARRIVILTEDDSVGGVLSAALGGSGATLERHRAVPDGGFAGRVDLCIAVVTSEATRVPATCPTLLVLERPILGPALDRMLAGPTVAGVVALDALEPERLAALAAQILEDDALGLARHAGAGATIESWSVADFDDKVATLAAVTALAERSGVPRRFAEQLEQCLDELLMNALYDAPVDASGTHVFAGVPPRSRMKHRTAESVTVQFAFDGRRAWIAVRDAFGSIERELLLRYLAKGLRSTSPLDQKAGGAGVGLYLAVSSVTSLRFHVVPRVATEAICMFDITAAAGLAELGFVVQRDARGAQPHRPARVLLARRVARRRIRNIGLAVLATAVVATGSGIAWSRYQEAHRPVVVTVRTVPDDVTIEIDDRTVGVAASGTYRALSLEHGHTYRIVGRHSGYDPAEATVTARRGNTDVKLQLAALSTLQLDSTPSGSTVEIAGEVIGTAPVTYSSSKPGGNVDVLFKREGYQTATAHLQVPARGGTLAFVQPLQPSPDYVRVKFVSEPAGAEVRRVGEEAGTDRTYTPAELFVRAGEVQSFVITMPHHVPMFVPPFTVERGADGGERGGRLVPGAVLRIESAHPGTVRVEGASYCQDLPVPADCTLVPGRYKVSLRTPDGTSTEHEVTVGATDLTDKFE